MNRRLLLLRFLAAFGGWLFTANRLFAAVWEKQTLDPIIKTEAEWRKILLPEVFEILRQEGTERALSSPLNHEKRAGVYHCAGCDLALFTSKMKYESGTGWPSFTASIPDRLGKKTDFKIIYPRTEYHCARCGGHQGHLFKDGPPPTGERWCNNGLALVFKPEDANKET
ncbi:MAG: peptide-methionine (R)-S-oxide reductase [Magnetococcales bacterium]|nr:peptide-methionine (R)-S-oxide reductase [Magnetococcales bacterium]